MDTIQEMKFEKIVLSRYKISKKWGNTQIGVLFIPPTPYVAYVQALRLALH